MYFIRLKRPVNTPREIKVQILNVNQRTYEGTKIYEWCYYLIVQIIPNTQSLFRDNYDLSFQLVEHALIIFP
jgi:hypothetical protein